MAKRRLAAAPSCVKSRTRPTVVAVKPVQLLDIFTALHHDLDVVGDRLEKHEARLRNRAWDYDGYTDDVSDEEEDDEDDDCDDGSDYSRHNRNRNRNRCSFKSVLTHVQDEVCRMREEIRAFGYVQSKWRPYSINEPHKKRRKLNPKLDSRPKQTKQLAIVSSCCQTATGQSFEFSRVHVPLPHQSSDGLRLQVCRNMKLQHPDQVRITTGGKTDQGLPTQKVLQVTGNTGALEVKLHYPVRTSVSPASVDILTLEVVAYCTWKDTDSIESARKSMSSMLKKMTDKAPPSRGGKKLLKFSWTGKTDSTCTSLDDDGLLHHEHGFWDPVLQIRDMSSARSARCKSHGTLLFEARGGEDMGAAFLAGGAHLATLHEEASKIPRIIVTQALTGDYLFDLDVAANDSVRSAVESKIRKRLVDHTSEFRYLNKDGVIVDPYIKTNAINQCKQNSHAVPVLKEGRPQRLFILDFVCESLCQDLGDAAVKSKGVTKVMKAKSLGLAAGSVQEAKSFGVVFIEEPGGFAPEYFSRSIILTKSPADAHQLVKVLAEPRPEFPMYSGKGSLLDLYRMKTVGEMFELWCRKKHRVQQCGKKLNTDLLK